ncbi:EscF/YscF/HrpA family type III secretion system needle major subunit [Variovorax sp. KK3]|uniref:EscF/YscF/HrpA family type III secretion system needle major subunit n=1 Tax=Variovorax sp. KK3 TaxID=1855728 RepID=UPI00097C0AC4|nr:EscF/YscF/HrpA family type III secretion system needle major subunit [Variovorax sp. KK3]
MALTLNGLVEDGSEMVSASNEQLEAQLAAVGTGDLDAADMMRLQMRVTNMSLTIQTYSSIVKEFGDSLKAVAQKF